MIRVENPRACTGCLICEMACSFHHVLRYSRSNSSIRVNISVFNPEEGARITIYYEKENQLVCDLCIGEVSPLCIRFCPEKVLKYERELDE